MCCECTGCGRDVRPSSCSVPCRECVTVDVIFVPTEIDNPIVGHHDRDGSRSIWLPASGERRR
jgi:hypothetical protein